MSKNARQTRAGIKAGPARVDATRNLDVGGRGPQHVTLIPTFGLPMPLHCPVCGQAIEARQEETWTITPCPHLAFVRYARMFEYASDDYDTRSGRVEDGGLEWDDFAKFLREAGYGAELLVIELPLSGRHCEDLDVSMVFGFDFAAQVMLRPETDSASAVTE